MSLLRLLNSGKSFIGNMDNTIRYQIGQPGMLPKFGSGRNPFLTGAKSETESQPPAVGAAPHSYAFSHLDGKREKATTTPNPVAAPLTPLSPLDGERESAGRPRPARLDNTPGLFQRIKDRISLRRSRATSSALPISSAHPMQAELSLDKVKVMRNDLTDADLEIIPQVVQKRLGVKKKIETAAKSVCHLAEPGSNDLRRPDEVTPNTRSNRVANSEAVVPQMK